DAPVRLWPPTVRVRPPGPVRYALCGFPRCVATVRLEEREVLRCGRLPTPDAPIRVSPTPTVPPPPSPATAAAVRRRARRSSASRVEAVVGTSRPRCVPSPADIPAATPPASPTPPVGSRRADRPTPCRTAKADADRVRPNKAGPERPHAV